MSQEAWTALYDAQISRYQAVFDADHNMDAKGGVVLGATLTVSVFVLSKNLFLTPEVILFSILIFGCSIYLLTCGILLYALHPRSYSLPANSTQDHPEYLTLQDRELIYQLVVDAEYATKVIESRLRKKAILMTIATVMFIIGTLTLLVIKLAVG